jgi:predicted deacylase
MAFSDLTKQLATEAIRSATAKPVPPAPPPENAGPAILGQVQAMQRALKEDEELVVTFHTGAESVRVMEFLFPSCMQSVESAAGGEGGT